MALRVLGLPPLVGRDESRLAEAAVEAVEDFLRVRDGVRALIVELLVAVLTAPSIAASMQKENLREIASSSD